MSNKELLPCPFCGGKARKEFNNCKMEYEVFCSCCDAVVSDESEIRAEKKWNTRNSSEIPNSSKEMPLVPKWQENEALAWIVIEISQFGFLFFDYSTASAKKQETISKGRSSDRPFCIYIFSLTHAATALPRRIWESGSMCRPSESAGAANSAAFR